MRFLFVFCFMLIGKFCYKSTALSCETWEYTDECLAITAEAVCPDSTVVLQGSVCGTGLEDARAGRATLLIDGPDKKVVRHYIRKI